MSTPVLHDVWAREGDGSHACQASVPVKAGGAVLVVFWQLSPAPCQSDTIPTAAVAASYGIMLLEPSNTLPNGSPPAPHHC